jgi:Asp/Glu/hydantoin racemase
MSSVPRITLLHATPVAIPPVQSAFATLWPDAETVDLLDSSLSIDRARQEAFDPELAKRFVTFGQYAHATGANGILVTCSAFGPAIDTLISELPIPVLKPNEAMFRLAIQEGKRIGMLATFAPAISTMTEEFEAFAQGTSATLKTVIVGGAIDALRRGDAQTHNELVAARVTELADCDAIMLAHFSTSQAFDLARSVTPVPLFSAPLSAVARMKQLVESKEN